MRFGLSDDQRALQEESARFFTYVAPKARRGEPGAWTALTKLGWQSVGIESEAGGSGGGAEELAVVLAEAGKAVLALPLLSTAGLAGAFLAHSGSGGQPFRARIAAGEAASLAFHHPDGFGLEPGRGVYVERGRLSGERGLVTDAAAAQFLVVPVVASSGDQLAIVECRRVHSAREHPRQMDPSRPLACISFDSTELAALLPLDLGAATDAALAALAAELLGVSEGALAQAVAYALEREQFGRKIGSFQAIKHRLADTYVAVERARSLVYAAAMLCDDQGADPALRTRTASMAKAAAAEAALAATAADVQIHAAIAMTTEHAALDRLRRARQGSALLGTHVAHLQRVGRSFVQEVAGGHP